VAAPFGFKEVKRECNEPMPVKEVRIVEKKRANDVAFNGVVDESAMRIKDALAMYLSK
ncbi:hypothetical protein HN51_037353, partial [Arachis hypogaea]